MKRILLVGKLNTVLKDINRCLSSHFHVQLCELRLDAAEGMLKVFEPDLVVVCLVGAQGVDEWIFGIMMKGYPKVPVITVGTEHEMKAFLRFYENRQFENLSRPVENKDILSAVCRKLGLEFTVEEDQYIVKELSLRKTVLIVDDSPVSIRGIRELIKDRFDVAVATSGIQAMTTIGKKRPDLILLDYEMPVCDGKQTLEMIRADEELKDIPVIFLTGINDKAHIEAVIKLKPQGYLLKPPSQEALIEAIEKKI